MSENAPGVQPGKDGRPQDSAPITEVQSAPVAAPFDGAPPPDDRGLVARTVGEAVHWTVVRPLGYLDSHPKVARCVGAAAVVALGAAAYLLRRRLR